VESLYLAVLRPTDPEAFQALVRLASPTLSAFCSNRLLDQTYSERQRKLQHTSLWASALAASTGM
jgi:hypothetical protein